MTGLVESWRHGVATLGPKEIKFVSTVGGVRFLKRRPVRLVVEHVDRSEQRQPTGLEIIAANPDARVVRVETSTAMLEWAILADRVLWAIEQVTGRPVA